LAGPSELSRASWCPALSACCSPADSRSALDRQGQRLLLVGTALRAGGDARLGAAQQAEAARLAVGVGFPGSFTTFSTFALDTHVLLTDGWPELATANVLISVVAGIPALRAGLLVGKACL